MAEMKRSLLTIREVQESRDNLDTRGRAVLRTVEEPQIPARTQRSRSGVTRTKDVDEERLKQAIILQGGHGWRKEQGLYWRTWVVVDEEMRKKGVVDSNSGRLLSNFVEWGWAMPMEEIQRILTEAGVPVQFDAKGHKPKDGGRPCLSYQCVQIHHGALSKADREDAPTWWQVLGFSLLWEGQMHIRHCEEKVRALQSGATKWPEGRTEEDGARDDDDWDDDQDSGSRGSRRSQLRQS